MGSTHCATGSFLIHNPTVSDKSGGLEKGCRFCLFVLGMLIALTGTPPVFCETESPISEAQSAEELAHKASEYFSAEKWDEAIRLNEEALSKEPSEKLKAGILLQLSSCFLKKGMTLYDVTKDDRLYQKSLEYAEQCLSVHPQEWRAFENMAIVNGKMRKLEQADFYYKKAERLVEPGSDDFIRLIAEHNIIREGIRINRKYQ